MAPSFRNGKKAVELALKACELSDWKNPGYLDTLAAAYARVGDFGNAVKWQEKALESPELANNTEAQQRLNFYLERKPWPAN
jgi:serine/threonine-protein kinase